MKNTCNIIDSHLHLDVIRHFRPEIIQWMKHNCYSAVSWSYSEKADSTEKLKAYLENKAQFIRWQSDTGLKCRYLAGIHPRCIPVDLRPEDVAYIISPFLDDPLCSGIGEIGLEEADARETEIFTAQLELGRTAACNGKVIGIHTPRSNKPSVTETTLNILKSFTDIASSIVIDHCTPETVSRVLDFGCMAGVSLSPSKSTQEELREIINICSGKTDRIMCNTDSATELYEDLADAFKDGGMPEDIRERIFYVNAAHFFRFN